MVKRGPMSAVGVLRRRVLTPSLSAVRFEVRGFPEKDRPSREHLETVGRAFLTGYGYAAEHGGPARAEPLLETVDHPYRGFAYEGAAMAFAILDAVRFGGESRVDRFLAGRGGRHVYMVHIGVGWAFARLPHLVRARIRPADPVLRWLALDGFGFHQAYFHTDRYVHRQYVEHVPWPGTGAWYVPHAVDQGIGRALWFVGGTDVDRVTGLIGQFPASRRADLWGGTGLAATYAGGAGEAELRDLWRRAGEHRPQLLLGCAVAAMTRVRAGLVTPHTRLASEVLCGMTPEQAAAVADPPRALPEADGEEPAYAGWRRHLAEALASTGRC
jgi:hypothetical protein